MEGRLRNAVSVNKRLYKLLLLILKIIPFLLSINETVFTILHYYDIECYSLNFFGGFSVLFLLQLYIMSYVFNYCKWHRVPLHYVTIVNILALYDTFVGIPLSDLLQKFIDDIDADNCNITMEQQSKIISVLPNIANPD